MLHSESFFLGSIHFVVAAAVVVVTEVAAANYSIAKIEEVVWEAEPQAVLADVNLVS